MCSRRTERANLIELPLVFLLGVVLCLGKAQAAAQAAPPLAPFTLSIASVSGSIKSGDQVKINATVRNTSSKDVQLLTDTRGTEVIYRVDVKDEGAKAPPDGKLKRDLKGLEDPAYLTPDTPTHFGVYVLTLKPGESITDPIIISKLYDMTRPGKYSIQVERRDENSYIFVKSNVITVTIAP
jgi:peptidyl-Lys metalloendopeptidase